jgi:MFS family permease
MPARNSALMLVQIVVISMLAHFVYVSARMTCSLYALAHQATALTIGVLMALAALFPMLIAVSAGRWMDRIGPHRPAWTGCLLMWSGVLVAAAVPQGPGGVTGLVVGLILTSLGTTLLMLVSQQVIGLRTEPHRRAAAFSWLGLGASVSGFSGPMLSGLMIDEVGHRWTLFALAGVTLLMALQIWHSHTALRIHEATGHQPASRHPFALLRHQHLRLVLIVSAMVSMSWDLLVFMVPVHGTRIGLAATQIGLVLSAFAAATFLVRLLIPWLQGRISEWNILAYTLVMAVAAFALFPLFSTAEALMAVAFLLGLGLGAALPNTMSLLHSSAPAGRVGEALGLRTMIMNGCHVALPLLFGAFDAVLGVRAIFWAMALITGLGAAAIISWQRSAGQRAVRERRD